jgi:hypothetical protein
MRVARVQFSNANNDFHRSTDKTYDYYTDLDLAIGDHVVVDSPSTGFVVVLVKDIIESETIRVSKWVVDKVDIASYNERILREKERQELLAVLDKKAKRVEETQKYQFLAAVDPEAAKMLERIQELSK